MQSIPDQQQEEGEHILSLDLQSLQTAAQGNCRAEDTKLGTHYTNQGYIITHDMDCLSVGYVIPVFF